MKYCQLLLIAPMMLVAAGCSTQSLLPKTEHESALRTEIPRPTGDSESLLAYFRYVRKLPAAEFSKEHETMRQLFGKSQSDFNRVRYAMLLSVPGAATSDETRALETLEPVLRNPNAALHNLAFMMSAHIQEQRRAQGLQQKLDALRSLEKSLIERDHKDGVKRP